MTKANPDELTPSFAQLAADRAATDQKLRDMLEINGGSVASSDLTPTLSRLFEEPPTGVLNAIRRAADAGEIAYTEAPNPDPGAIEHPIVQIRTVEPS